MVMRRWWWRWWWRHDDVDDDDNDDGDLSYFLSATGISSKLQGDDRYITAEEAKLEPE